MPTPTKQPTNDASTPAERLGVTISGSLLITVAGYELEIDHESFASGGAIFLCRTGFKNFPIRIGDAAKLAAAIQRVASIAQSIEELGD